MTSTIIKNWAMEARLRGFPRSLRPGEIGPFSPFLSPLHRADSNPPRSKDPRLHRAGVSSYLTLTRSATCTCVLGWRERERERERESRTALRGARDFEESILERQGNALFDKPRASDSISRARTIPGRDKNILAVDTVTERTDRKRREIQNRGIQEEAIPRHLGRAARASRRAAIDK